jgi:hypothetical protein
MVPAMPRNLPVWTGQPGVIPIGYAVGRTGGVGCSGCRWMTCSSRCGVGKSRYGETETALVQAVALALSGTDGVWVPGPAR